MQSGIPIPGTYLDFRTYPETLGRALVMHLALAHRVTTAPDGATYYEDTSTLRGARSDVLDTNEDAAPALAQVGPSPGSIWAWYRFSSANEDERTIRPSDVAEGSPGRWVRQHIPMLACGKARYYQHVEMAPMGTPAFAPAKGPSLYSRARGRMPALFVSCLGDDPEEASATQAFHHVKANFRLRVISENFRGGVAAGMTAPLQAEAAADPGALRMIGDLRDYLIKDNVLGLDFGLKRIRIGAWSSVADKNVDRQQVDQLDITCFVKTWTPNESCEIQSPWELWVQLQDMLGRNVGPSNQVGAPT